MKTLLRSMYVSSSREDKVALYKNYLKFKEVDLEFTNLQDNDIWLFIDDFSNKYNELPSYSAIRSSFERENNLLVLDRLEILDSIASLTGGSFVLRLEQRIEDLKSTHFKTYLEEAAQIASSGVKIKEGYNEVLLKGPTDAANFLNGKLAELLVPTRSEKLSGNITVDTVSSQKEYELREKDPDKGQGSLYGIPELDSLGGAKKKELWTHAAFTGGLKSTLALNWFYNQAIFYKNPGMFVSLEMPYTQCRRIINAMHSMHSKFNDIRMELGLQSNIQVPVGLSYTKIRDALLNDKEKYFYYEHVLKDLSNPDNEYGAMELHEADPNKSNFTILDIRQKAEMIYTKTPIQTLFVDHAGLLDPVKKHSTTTESQNEVMRNLKKLAQGFNSGQGIPVVALFQINRGGYETALKTGGLYNLTHLSYANECEKSSDVVTAGWIDDSLRKMNRLFMQCLKTRDDAPFEPFHMRVEFASRRLLECQDSELIDNDADYYGDQIDMLSEEDLADMF